MSATSAAARTTDLLKQLDGEVEALTDKAARTLLAQVDNSAKEAVAGMNAYIIRYTRIPTNFNPSRNAVIEAASPEDALVILRDRLGEGNGVREFVIDAPKPYTKPPAGRVVTMNEGQP